MSLLKIVLILMIASSIAQAVPQDVYLEIYNRDQALVREIHTVDLDKGLNSIDFRGIAEGIYGHTAQITPLKHPENVNTRSVSYNYDLVTHDKLLQKYLGQWFSFNADDMIYEGRLLRMDDEHIFLQPDTTELTIEVIQRGKLTEMYYPSLPEGLYTEPTIVWTVNSDKKHKNEPVELSYLTSDVSWMCDYRAEIIDDGKLKLSGYFTIDNQLPISFQNANIALVAGSTHRSTDPAGSDASAVEQRSGQSDDKRSGADAQKFFEYYRFTLENKFDLQSNRTIQTPYFEAMSITAEKRFTLPHLYEGENVRVQYILANSKANGLGLPLPEGDIGIYRRADDGALSFVGEDFLGMTPVGGEAKIDVGSAFDLTAKRQRLAQVRPAMNKHEETWQVEINSARDADCVVHVEQKVFGYFTLKSATVNGADVSADSENAGSLIFLVKVDGNSVSKLIFTLEYGY